MTGTVTYYPIDHELEDRPVNTIPILWKVTHVSGFLIVSVIGFMGFYLVTSGTVLTGRECVLYSNLELSLVEPGKWIVIVEYSDWGTSYDCGMPLLVTLLTFVYGTVFCILFFMCGADRYGLSPPSQMVIPGFVLCTVGTISSIYCMLHVTKGLDTFCKHIYETLRYDIALHRIFHFQPNLCGLANVTLLLEGRSITRDYICFDIAIIVLCFQCVMWTFNGIVIIARCLLVTDFVLINTIAAKYKEDTPDNSQEYDYYEGYTPSLESIVTPKSSTSQNIPKRTVRILSNSVLNLKENKKNYKQKKEEASNLTIDILKPMIEEYPSNLVIYQDTHRNSSQVLSVVEHTSNASIERSHSILTEDLEHRENKKEREIHESGSVVDSTNHRISQEENGENIKIDTDADNVSNVSVQRSLSILTIYVKRRINKKEREIHENGSTIDSTNHRISQEENGKNIKIYTDADNVSNVSIQKSHSILTKDVERHGNKKEREIHENGSTVDSESSIENYPAADNTLNISMQQTNGDLTEDVENPRYKKKKENQ